MDETSAAVDSLIADLAKGAQEPPAGDLPAIWTSLEDLGLAGVGLAEDVGGSGGDLTDLIALAESVGRHVVSSPLLENGIARWALGEANVPAPPGVCTVSMLAPDVVLNLGGGTVDLFEVPWARHAAVLLVVSASGVHLVDLRRESVRIVPRVNEAGEERDDVTFNCDAAVVVASAPSVAAIRNRLALLWAAVLAGTIESAYGLTRDYVNGREQFGAPLVRIPAVAGLLATVKAELVQVEAGLQRAKDHALHRLDSAETTAAVAAARVTAARAATVAARLAHQLHGGMGITAEYPLHLYTSRLWAWRDEAGSEHQWATSLGGAAAGLGEDAVWDVLTSP
ncbi:MULTISPECIES: acyl-CoA dehydrogenase family protein [unclassified Nocardioides]|uniref:acyl-CoA dehydrogenase family protein n=1 Tax=unclassified Nocardioides TaxID=2615069 RepID=UPI000AD24298|nr:MULTISPECIES: acyl-CoA dehydrogenase family protein [unclassified Nocardioides]